MNRTVQLLFCALLLLNTACNRNAGLKEQDPKPSVFTTGIAYYWGDYYAAIGVPQQVYSLLFFTQNVGFTDEGYIGGVGHYLHFDDVFVAPDAQGIGQGLYSANSSGEPFSFIQGERIGAVTKGTYLYTLTETAALQTLLSEGTFEVVATNSSTQIRFQLKSINGTAFEGSFSGELQVVDRTNGAKEHSPVAGNLQTPRAIKSIGTQTAVSKKISGHHAKSPPL